MAKRKTVKKSKKTNGKHPWDETLVIAVLVASALSILLLLASYISVTGQAYSSIPSREGVLNGLSGAVVVEGSGKAKCTVQCKNVGQICILAHQNDAIVECNTKIVGSYNCLCSGTEKVIGTVPGTPITKIILESNVGQGKTYTIGDSQTSVIITAVFSDKCVFNLDGTQISILVGETQAGITVTSIDFENKICNFVVQ